MARSWLRAGLRSAGRGLRAASRIPGLSTIARAVPFVGTAMAAYEGINLGRSLLGGGGGGSLLGGGGGAMPPMFSPGGGQMMIPPSTMGKRSIFRDDPNVSEQLKPYAIDDRFLKTYQRAPKGFVVLHDAAGDAFAIPKAIAKAHGLWKPAAKPPISVRDWHHLQGAGRVVKKFRSMEKIAMRIANFHSARRANPQTQALKAISAGAQLKALAKAAS